MSTNVKRFPPTGPPPAYQYVTRYYKRSLRPVVVAMSLIAAVWALAWTVISFKELNLAQSDDFPKLAPLAIAQGAVYAVACLFQVFGVVASGTQRPALVKMYAFLCALSAVLVVGIGLMRVVTHFMFKSDLIAECTTLAENGTIGSVFGIWGTSPDSNLSPTDAADYCDTQWNHDSWAEVVTLLIEGVLGLLFTSLAFAYYRQVLDPASPANSSRVPANQPRGDGYPSYYSPPYDAGAYAPVYPPPAGPPPEDGKPPEYKRGSYPLFREDKNAKEDDPFADYGGPSVPMPTHWVEDRDGAARV